MDVEILFWLPTNSPPRMNDGRFRQVSKRERTQVGIIGAGPAGLLLARLLEVHGIESVILEARTRDYVEARIRAGVLEQGTVALLEEAGVAERLHREGLVHDGAEIAVGGRRVRIDFRALTGKTVTVYGQTEMTRDLIAARLAGDGPIVWEAADVGIHDIETARPRLSYRQAGAELRAGLRLHRRLRRLPWRQPLGRAGVASARPSSASIPSAGWASWPTCRRARAS